MEEYTTGTGQLIKVHTQKDCIGDSCVIHKPSFHKMNGWPTHWRGDRHLMERICKHGIGHPDPDDLSAKKLLFSEETNKKSAWSVHGCDGCCK